MLLPKSVALVVDIDRLVSRETLIDGEKRDSGRLVPTRLLAGGRTSAA